MNATGDFVRSRARASAASTTSRTVLCLTSPRVADSICASASSPPVTPSTAWSWPPVGTPTGSSSLPPWLDMRLNRILLTAGELSLSVRQVLAPADAFGGQREPAGGCFTGAPQRKGSVHGSGNPQRRFGSAVLT